MVNIVDVPARCTFIVPSILRRDQLTIAVSTEGASPGLAKRIRTLYETLGRSEVRLMHELKRIRTERRAA